MHTERPAAGQVLPPFGAALCVSAMAIRTTTPGVVGVGKNYPVNVIFTPKLSLQLYSQLFAARGRFSDFSVLANPSELRSFDYPKQPDFSFQSFQTNVVLRWEYRPGSTLFVVWTQSRNVSEAERLLLDGGISPGSPFDNTTGSQLRDTFAVFPNNVFLVKLNYLILR